MAFLGGLFDTGKDDVPLPQFQTPYMFPQQNMQQAGQSAFGGLQGLGGLNMYNQFMPQFQNVAKGMMNDPNAANWQFDANTAAGMGKNAATNQYNYGAGLYNQAQNLFGDANNLRNQAPNLFSAGNSLWQMGADPQKELYARTQQQLQEQTRASQAARGIQTSPYGAGVENKAMSDFNIDWQNQQLGRTIAAGQGMANLYGQAGNLYGQAGQSMMQGGQLAGMGGNMQANASPQFYNASMLPYQTSQNIGQNRLNVLNQQGQFGQNAATQQGQEVGGWMNYLGFGNQATGDFNRLQQNQFQNQMEQQKLNNQQDNQLWGGIGGLIGKAMPYAFAPFTGGASLMAAPFLGNGSQSSMGGGWGGGAFSDARVKEDIAPIGELYDHTPVYLFRYKGDPTPRVGLMAQDVEEFTPEAVGDFYGIKTVDYVKATELSRGIAALSHW